MKLVLITFAFLTLTLLGSAQTPSSQILGCGITPQLRQKLLDAHNDYRNKVANGSETNQPGAVDMQAMTYNMTLEAKASAWASTCPTGHNPDQKDANGVYLGENIYYAWDPTRPTSFDASLGVSAVAAWYSEVKDFTSDMIKPFQFGSKIGHYSQVVWASSTSVGCGIVLCNDTRAQFASYPYNTVIICNYSPAGNWDAGTMYTAATGTAGCSSTPNTVYAALCGNPNLTVSSAAGSCGNFKPASATTSTSITVTTAQSSGSTAPVIATGPKWVAQNVASWTKKNAAKLKTITTKIRSKVSKADQKLSLTFSLLFVLQKGKYTQLVVNVLVKGKAKYQVFVIYSANSMSLNMSTKVLVNAKAMTKAMTY